MNNSFNQQMSYVKILKQLSGYSVKVSGSSMEPTLSDGQSIKVCNISKCGNISIGDIVLFQKFADHLTIHRVIDIVFFGKTHKYYKTKGDGNAKEDEYVVFEKEIIGMVIT